MGALTYRMTYALTDERVLRALPTPIVRRVHAHYSALERAAMRRPRTVSDDEYDRVGDAACSARRVLRGRDQVAS